MKRQANLMWWLPALLVLGVIWHVTLGRSAATSALLDSPLVDWVGHLAAYFALAYSVGRASGHSRLALVLTVWCGAMLEVQQSFRVGHNVGLSDWWPVLLGALLGARACRLSQRRARALQRHTLQTPDPVEYQDVA